MSVTTKQLDAMTEDQPESTDPVYLAWRDEKVSAALDAAQADPDRRIPQSEVWKKFGLEA